MYEVHNSLLDEHEQYMSALCPSTVFKTNVYIATYLACAWLHPTRLGSPVLFSMNMSCIKSYLATLTEFNLLIYFIKLLTGYLPNYPI